MSATGKGIPWNFINWSIFNALVPKNGPKAVPLEFDFSIQPSYLVDLTMPQQQGIVDIIQTVFIDNSSGPSPLTVGVSKTNINVTCQPYSQGFFPILVPNPPVLTVSSNGGSQGQVILINVPMPAMSWCVKQTAPSFTAGGAMIVAEQSLDALIANGALNVLENSVASGAAVMPRFISNLRASFTATAAGVTVVGTGPAANNLYLSDWEILLTPDATLAAAGPLTVQFLDNGTLISQSRAVVPAAAAAGLISPIVLTRATGFYNQKALNTSLQLNLSAALVTGEVIINMGYGIGTNIA